MGIVNFIVGVLSLGLEFALWFKGKVDETWFNSLSREEQERVAQQRYEEWKRLHEPNPPA